MKKLAIGRIRTAHGVKGYLKVQSFSGETGHFLNLKEVVLKNKNREKVFRIEDVRPIGSSVLFKLEGIDTPEHGKQYSGWDIWVDKNFASPLAEDEYYVCDMIGCKLIFNGKVVGTVRSITDNSISDLLEIITDHGSHLIPFKDEFIGEVNIPEGRIELKDDGLLS